MEKQRANIRFDFSFRSRFRFMRHLDKKNNHHSQQTSHSPKTPQQTFKHPLLMDSSFQ